MVKSIGIIGLSEGNGHPFSYSSIINGYSDEGLAASGWPGIYEYVRRRHALGIRTRGLEDHARLDSGSGIHEEGCVLPVAFPTASATIGNLWARWMPSSSPAMTTKPIFRWHWPFLEAGLPVFVDKPLSLEVSELRAFKPYLEKGQLMSCSGMRYSRELDEPRADLAAYGRLKLIRGAIVLSWEKYGVHLLEAILAITPARPVSVRMLPAEHASAVVRLDDGVLIQIDALGECARTFHIEIFGTQRTGAFDITDNFSMFRRMLWQFAESIRTGRPAIPPERTLEIMRVLIAGRMARNENREVLLNEIPL